MSGSCYLEACVGGSHVSEAFRVFCRVICSIKICLKEKKKKYRKLTFTTKDFVNTIPPTTKQYCLYQHLPCIRNAFERNYSKNKSSYYFRKLLPNIYFDFTLLNTVAMTILFSGISVLK